MLSNAITDVGYHMSSQLNSQHSNYNSNENFELVVSEGWLYLYDTNTGQVWTKPDNPEGIGKSLNIIMSNGILKL